MLDFAFRIHSDVGLKFNNAMVNNVIKPIGYILKSGDVVSINTFKNKYTATKYRLDYLHTPTAKTKLTRFLKSQEKEVYVNKGIQILDTKLLKYDLPTVNSDKDKIKKYYGEQFEQTMMQVASKAITPTIILKQVYNIVTDKQNVVSEKKVSSDIQDSVRLLIDDSLLLSYDLCPLCKPIPHDKTIARSGKDGIKIHTMSCKALQTLSLDRLIKTRRSDQDNTIYHFDLEIAIDTKNMNLIALLSILQEL